MPNDMQELQHQARMGKAVAVSERKRPRLQRVTRPGSILINGDIPARILAFNDEVVVLRYANGRQLQVKRSVIEGRFKYSKTRGSPDA